MGQPWGRLYTGTRHHRKIRILRQRCPDSWWIFYPLLEMAFETDNDGLIYIDPDIPYSPEELAGEVGTRVDVLEETLHIMADLRLISLEKGFVQFLSYRDRQYKSDTSAERTRKYRERMSQKGKCDGDVTSQDCHGDGDTTSQQRPGDVTVTPPDTDTDINPSVISTSVDMTPPQGEDSYPPEKTEQKGPTRKADRKLPPYSLEFEAFWKAYPNKKGGKEEAWAIWNRRLKAGTLPPLNYLLECIHKLTQDQEWMEYAPMVTTFLNKGRWSDVEGLKKSPLAAPSTRIDPNCPKCKGEGFVPVEKDGKKYTAPCPCRKITHG